MIAALVPIRRCFDFSGRSDRREFWSYSLLAGFVMAVSYSVMDRGYWLVGYLSLDWETSESLWKVGWVMTVCAVFVFLPPMLALTVRRLHDIDESGWYTVIAFIPLGCSSSFQSCCFPERGRESIWRRSRSAGCLNRHRPQSIGSALKTSTVRWGASLIRMSLDRTALRRYTQWLPFLALVAVCVAWWSPLGVIVGLAVCLALGARCSESIWSAMPWAAHDCARDR